MNTCYRMVVRYDTNDSMYEDDITQREEEFIGISFEDLSRQLNEHPDVTKYTPGVSFTPEKLKNYRTTSGVRNYIVSIHEIKYN